MAIWAAEARVLVRPFRAYGLLRASNVDAGASDLVIALRRPFAWLLSMGAFVSLSGAGRLVFFHQLFGMAAWIFVPLLQMLWLMIALSAVSKRDRGPRSIDLFFAGEAHWFLLLFLLTGVCLFLPDAWRAFQWLFQTQILPIAVLLACIWSVVVTFAFFRSGLAWTRAQSFKGLGIYYGGFASTIVCYYLLMGQLIPLIRGSS